MSQEKILKSFARHTKLGHIVIPMITPLIREVDGTKRRPILPDWKDYKSGTKKATEEDFKRAKGLAVLTGPLSDLTIVDFDSLDALDACEQAVGFDLFEKCPYFFKTYKGFQFFFKYDADLSASIGARDKVDVLTDGRLTYADEANDKAGYVFSGVDEKVEIPKELKQYLLDGQKQRQLTKVSKPFTYQDSNLSLDDISLRNPLGLLIERWLQNGHDSHLNASLISSIFKGFNIYNMSELALEGKRHMLTLRLIGCCFANPTVSLEQYEEFVPKFVERYIKPDKDDDIYTNMKVNEGKQKPYDAEWRKKFEERRSQQAIEDIFLDELYAHGYEVWRNENDYYVSDHLLQTTKKYLKGTLVEEVERIAKEHGLLALFKEAKFKPKHARSYDSIIFEPNKPFGPDSRTQTNTDRLNTTRTTFNRHIQTSYLGTLLQAEKDFEQYPELKKKVKIPYYINIILTNILPNPEHRKWFIHNIAYALRKGCKFNVTPVLQGEVGGTGKNLLLEEIIGRIVGRMYTKRVSNQELSSNFSAWKYGCRLAIWNEVKETKGQGIVALYAALKDTVRDKYTSAIRKGKDAETIINRMMIFILTNERHPFDIDEFDSRLNFFQTSDIPLIKIIPEAAEADFSDKYLEPEIDAFCEYLASIELSDKEFNRIIDTPLRRSIIEASKKPEIAFVQSVFSGDVEDVDSHPEVIETLTRWRDTIKSPYMPVTDFNELLSKAGFTKWQEASIRQWLRQHGAFIGSKYLSTRKQTVRCIEVCLGLSDPGHRYERPNARELERMDSVELEL